MRIDIEQIQECESLIASGRTGKAIDLLLAEKDQTAYKQELLSISNRWRKLDRDAMANVLSDSERAVREGRINSSLLLLLNILTKESQGEKPSSEELHALRSEAAAANQPALYWIPWVITVLALGLLVWQLTRPTVAANCLEVAQINGDWVIILITANGDEAKGQATIQQDPCQGYFTISGQVDLKDDDLIFSSRIGGIHDGEILFIYENIEGEIGLCRGVLSGMEPQSFSLHYYDIEGYDQQDDSGGRMRFSRIDATN